MATTQNGWTTIANHEIDRSPIPGTNVIPLPGLRQGDVATVLLHVGKLFNERVMAVYNPGCWGWNSPTPIPGSNVISNHGSGTAMDLNAPSFPWKTYTMTPAQREACRQIVREVGGVVTWGGDFHTYVDEMHFEISSSASVEDVARVARAIRTGSVLGATATQQKGDTMSQRLTNQNHLRILFQQFVDRDPTAAEIKDYMTQGTLDYALGKLFPARKDLGLVLQENAVMSGKVKELSSLKTTVEQLKESMLKMEQLEQKEDIIEATKDAEITASRQRISELEKELEMARSTPAETTPESPAPAPPKPDLLTKLFLLFLNRKSS